MYSRQIHVGDRWKSDYSGTIISIGVMYTVAIKDFLYQSQIVINTMYCTFRM